jgi:VanZ family protein
MLKPPLRLVQAAFWACVLGTVFLSLLPVELLPQAFNWWDKAQHALGFAVLAVLGLLAYPKTRWRLPWGLLLLGGFIELAQAATGWRHGDWLDLLADAVGVLVVMTAWYLGRSKVGLTASSGRD